MRNKKGVDMCTICEGLFTEEQSENGNIKITVQSIPGYVHKKCRSEMSKQIISDSFNKIDLSKENF